MLSIILEVIEYGAISILFASYSLLIVRTDNRKLSTTADFTERVLITLIIISMTLFIASQAFN